VTIGFAVSIVVGAALLLAGGAKVAAGAAWPQQARALGAPEPAIVMVPWIEITVGALLCVHVARPIPALIAGALLVSFTALLVTRLVKGERPACACFGSWSARPLGWRHLVRNLVLIVLSILAAVVA
jgi:hypothetical protein